MQKKLIPVHNALHHLVWVLLRLRILIEVPLNQGNPGNGVSDSGMPADDGVLILSSLAFQGALRACNEYSVSSTILIDSSEEFVNRKAAASRGGDVDITLA